MGGGVLCCFAKSLCFFSWEVTVITLAWGGGGGGGGALFCKGLLLIGDSENMGGGGGVFVLHRTPAS